MLFHSWIYKMQVYSVGRHFCRLLVIECDSDYLDSHFALDVRSSRSQGVVFYPQLESTRRRAYGLVAQAYTSISADDFASFVGYSVEEAVKGKIQFIIKEQMSL